MRTGPVSTPNERGPACSPGPGERIGEEYGQGLGGCTLQLWGVLGDRLASVFSVAALIGNSQHPVLNSSVQK